MGWTGQAKEGRTTHEVIVEELEGYSPDSGYKVIDHSGKYYALQVPKGDVIGIVALTEHHRNHGETWIYTKMVSEDMGPYEKDCPLRILDKLTPLDEMEGWNNSYAAEWREACRENAALKASQPKLRPGMKIKTASPVEFTGGWTMDTFTFIRQFTFEGANGVRVRLPKNWKRRYKWEVVV